MEVGLSASEKTVDGVVYIGKNQQGHSVFKNNKDQSLMVRTPAGHFEMGSPLAKALLEYEQSNLTGALEEWFSAESPVHKEHVGSLLVDQYPVINMQFEKFTTETGYLTEAERSRKGWRWDIRTQKWKQVRNWNWRTPKGDKFDFPNGSNYPVVQVTREDANEYCRWAGKRLPTETEWEYLCRAGTTTRYYWGEDPDYLEINQYAWYIGNSKGSTHEVGEKRPNPWGLYDMSGNVWEWVSDVYRGYEGTACKSNRFNQEWYVLRGGAWYFHPTYLRSAYRGTTIRGNFVGFRCVKDAPLHQTRD